jgi:hypothetical protein
VLAYAPVSFVLATMVFVTPSRNASPTTAPVAVPVTKTANITAISTAKRARAAIRTSLKANPCGRRMRPHR